MVVKVDSKGVLGVTKLVDGYLSDYSKSIDSARATVQEINGIWRGGDYNKFKGTMDDFFGDLKKLEDEVASYNNFLKGYIEAEEKLDNFYYTKKIELK